jgi:hypothetical protein
MQPRLLVFSDRAYRLLLRAYPPAFQDRFAMEMAQVFRSICYQAYTEAGLGGLMHLWMVAFWDWMRGAVYQWRLRLLNRRRETMQTTPLDRRNGIQPLSPFQAGLATLPFLAFGIASMVNKLEYFHTTPASFPLWKVLLIDPFLVFYWLILIGLGAGILAGFPRWAFSYLGWALLFAWWWSDMGFYGYSLDWKIWLPLLGVILLALLIRRSIQPLRALFTGLWREWTLLFLGLYILYGFVFMLYDENHHPYLLAFIAATTLVVCLGAWGYFHSRSALSRILALVAGLVLAAGLGGINSATWDYRAYYGLPEGSGKINPVGFIVFAGIIILMAGLGLLARRRLPRNSTTK